MKVLVIGITGMLGNALFRRLGQAPGIEALGTLRSAGGRAHFDAAFHPRIRSGVDAIDFDSVTAAVAWARADVIINCVGLIKQLDAASDPVQAISLNALFPHRLAALASASGARLVHVSTDCVFSGRQGHYRESDAPDATDLYGRSKLLGEVAYPHTITLRTSIIGRELASAHALVDWFLAQSGTVSGYTRAVFSGVPTVELADIIIERVLPHPELSGLYHVAAAPIAKYDLLSLVSEAYGTPTVLVADDRLVIDRSLDASRFNAATGYTPAAWPSLIDKMKQFG